MAIGQIVQEYAGAIKVIVCALALIGIIVALCSTEAGGVVMTAFKTMLTDFYTKASALGGLSST